MTSFLVLIRTGLIAVSIIVVMITGSISQIHGHGVAACCWTGFYRIQNESFLPPRTIVGETITVTGELSSLVNRPITIAPLPIYDKNTNSSALVNNTSNSSSPTWELISSSITDEFVLEPGEDFPFKFEIRALKAGVFHLHTAFNAMSIGLSMGRGQTITVYSDSEELNEKENSFYMLQVQGKNRVIQYGIRDLENNERLNERLKVSSIVANPQNMSMDIRLSSMNATTDDEYVELEPTRAYFDLLLEGDNLEMLSYPSKFSVYVDGKNIQLENANSSCNYYYLRIPIFLNSKEITLHGSIDTDIPTISQSPHTKIMQPLTVFTVQPRNDSDDPGQSTSRHYYFEVGMATNADRCRLNVIDLLQEEKRLHISLDGVPTEDVEPRFLSIAIPQKLLGGNYTVLIDDEVMDFQQRTMDGSIIERGLDPKIETSENWSVISLNYTSDAREIDILGTTAIPEFNSHIIAGIAIFVVVIGGVAAAVKGRGWLSFR